MKPSTVFLLIPIFFLAACTPGHQGKFYITNKASEPIAELSVTVSEQTSSYKNIQPSDTVKGGYKVTKDSAFKITGKFKSGKAIAKEDGIIKPGLDYNHDIEVTDQDVVLKSLQVK